MTIISTEMLKWKRNKTVLGIFILTAILGIFAVERAFSISRSSSLMNSFSDLYTLAFKNLTSLFLPIVLSMFATTLFFDEQKNDTLKGLLIIPISKTQLYFSKIAVVIFMSLALCLLTFAICILGGFLAGGFTDLNTETILQVGLHYFILCLSCLFRRGLWDCTHWRVLWEFIPIFHLTQQKWLRNGREE